MVLLYGATMNAYIVCVDYHDILAQTLPLNRHHFDRVNVVTDKKHYYATRQVTEANNASLTATDSFYAGGATFNKWVALEELFDQCGRDGWLVIIDADIVWPNIAPLDLIPGKLYTPARYMYPEVKRIPPESEWSLYPIHRNLGEWAGYTQIFHADDPVLGPPPWHEINWRHAGGADSFFQRKWAKANKIRPSWNCLHVGPSGMNWCGRATAYADGSVPSDSDDKVAVLRQFMAGRRTMRNYEHERIKP